jgi:amino acid permease
MIKFEGFFFIAALAIVLFAFIDCARRDETEIKKLPKWGWLIAILFTGSIGSIIYLVIGRGPLAKFPNKKPQKRILPPDDDPDFLRGI